MRCVNSGATNTMAPFWDAFKSDYTPLSNTWIKLADGYYIRVHGRGAARFTIGPLQRVIHLPNVWHIPNMIMTLLAALSNPLSPSWVLLSLLLH